jgi:hypothetical protein
MEPAIVPGARVKVRAGALCLGDVFVFEIAGGALEMHRLVLALPGGWLVHRGDNQREPTLGVTHRARVIGRADLPARPPGVLLRLCALAMVARRTPAAVGRRWRRRRVVASP